MKQKVTQYRGGSTSAGNKPRASGSDMKLTLVTNLDFIQMDRLRLDCSALLLEEQYEGLPGMEKQFRIRGFGPDGAWPVFSLWLEPTVTWQIAGSADSSQLAVILGEAGTERPIFSGMILELSTGLRFFLQIEDNRFPLDLEDVTTTGFPDLWAILERKTEEYWRSPNMPKLYWKRPTREPRGRGTSPEPLSTEAGRQIVQNKEEDRR
jgi:hypothetical protein